MEDRYRTPDTQKDFARKWSQSPTMVTSFADGTKVSIEQAIVANATGMCVARRGMIGMEHPGHVDDLTMRYDINALRNCGGIVDYTIGSKPGPGVFVLADASDNVQARYLDYGKLGPGPLYSFYVPYHLPVFEAPTSIARVAHFRDCAIAAKFGPQVDVISMSKKDLECGDVIDGIGGHCVYGVCENADVCHEQKLLPIGMADGCRMKRSVPRDEAITYDDIELPRCRMVDSLRDAQDRRFFGSSYVPVNNQ
jgi:predicted homoserine dehydrogenase-like protein